MPTRSSVSRIAAFLAACALLSPPALAQNAPPLPSPSEAPAPPVPESVTSADGRYALAVGKIAHDAGAAMRRQHAPGMVLALTDRRGTLGILVFGDADVAARRPVTRATRFGIGSITKSMTAIALLQARDRGAFDLHAPVTRYLPWFSVRTRWRPLTPHDLLTHTSGLPDGGLGYGAPYDVTMLRDQRTGFAPGAHWSYSNVGYETLGEIVRAVDRRPWADAVRDGVLARAGMTSSATDWSFDTLATAATGYLPREDDRIPDPRAWNLTPVPFTELTDAAGSVLATGDDMAKYARVLLNGGVSVDTGKRLISPASYALLTTAHTVAGGPSVPGMYQKYAYGLAVSTLDGDRIVGHTGGTVPYTACLEADLTTGFAAVALTNVGETAERPCAIVEHALRTLRAASKNQLLPAFPKAPDPAQVKGASRYAGTYRAPNGGAITVIAPSAERLAVVANGAEHPLLPVAPGLFWTDVARFRASGIRFIPDAAAHRANELVAAGRWYATAAYRGRITFPHPTAWDAYAGHYRYPGAHPWDPSIRVQLVKGALVVDDGNPIAPLPDGSFRLGGDAWSAERLRFDTVVDGRAQRVLLTGVALYRVPTP
jgi:D-alanyl-D-alanine carboxypeptidase